MLRVCWALENEKGQARSLASFRRCILIFY